VATSRIKVSVLEQDTVELENPTEFDLTAHTLFYDPAGTPFVSDNVGEALAEIDQRFNAINPSMAKRFITSEVTIAASEEMIVSDMIDISPLGCLTVSGMLTILNF
jgi:hypothetical protein